MHRSRRKSRKSSTPFGNALVIACIKLMTRVPEQLL
jgi:hypothetical protein